MFNRMGRSTRLAWMDTVLILLAVPVFVTGSPQITAFTKVATLYEGVQTNEILSTIQCSDPDGDLTNTYVQSMKPASPCAKCFEILDCLPDECLEYRAGVGTLSHSSAPSYLLTIVCDDGKETPATEVVEVKIIPNSPPYFDPHFDGSCNINAQASGPGTTIYDADAADDESDDLTYSMTVTPSSSSGNYKIDPITGEITSTVDLRTECRPDVTFNVYADDGHNKRAGPQVIGCVLDNANVAPIATNLDTTCQVREDASGTAYTMNFLDGNGDPVTYTYTASNAAGLAQFKIDGKDPNIDIATALDYEQSALRQTDLVITATDGYCTSPPYTLRLQVTDVNEPPTIEPEESSVEVCEFDSEFDPGYVLNDPDTIDTQFWTLHSSMGNNLGYYGINHDNGFLQLVENYDVDPPNSYMKKKDFVVQVEDKGGLTATATVSVSIVDCNDNAPVMVKEAYSFRTTECAAPGNILGRIEATDLDTAREQNNVFTFSGSGGAVSVGTGGEVVLNSPLPAGNVITFNAYATDKGQTPGPLRSKNPAVISVTFTPCPTTPPPTTAPPPGPPTTTTTTTTTTKFTRESDDPNLPWIIIAALLGTFMIGLLSFMLWRYGPLCGAACRNCNANCAKSCKGRHRPAKPKETKVEPIRRKPLQKEKPPSRPPSEPEPEEKEPAGPGFLFGFWKERYPNDDIKNKTVNRNTLPQPGDMENHFPHTIDPVDPPPGAQAAQAAADAPNKKCVIQ